MSKAIDTTGAGLKLPVRFVRAVDGDTIEVQGELTQFLWVVRLRDCWCPELRDSDESLSTLAHEAKREAAAICSVAKSMLLWIPIDGDFIRHVRAQGKGLNLLAFTSFERVLGYLLIDGKINLSEKLVEMKLASSTKEGRLGE